MIEGQSMALLNLAIDADLIDYMPKGFFKSCELAPSLLHGFAQSGY
jgi:hypothetical protein